MKNLSTVLTGIVLIFSSCTFSTKTTETNHLSESSTTSSIVNTESNEISKPGNYHNNDADLAQLQRALNISRVPISASIRARVLSNYNKSHSLAANTSQSSSTLESYSATTIPGIYLSKPIKSKIRNIEQDQNPTFHAHSSTQKPYSITK